MNSPSNNDLERELDRHRAGLTTDDDDAFCQRHEALLRLLGAQPPYPAAYPVELVARDDGFLRAAHRRYLGTMESRVNHILRETARQPGTLRETLITSFGRAAYDRLTGLHELLPDPNPGSITMVGCGPAPVALFYLADTISECRGQGLDIDEPSVRQAQALSTHLGATELSFRTMNGLDFDYRSSDLVYIANLVSPKEEVLRVVADQLASHAVIVVREPVGLGVLLAETATHAMPDGFQVIGRGPPSIAFLSRDVVLARAPRE